MTEFEKHLVELLREKLICICEVVYVRLSHHNKTKKGTQACHIN